MIHRIAPAVLALLVTAPLAAQAPAGWEMRVDHSTNAADPDDVAEVTVTTEESGFVVRTGPAVTLWHPENRAAGEYTLEGTFTLLEPSNHVNYYGLIYGGSDLEGDQESYVYFLVAQNGSFIIRHRAGNETVHDIVPRTSHDAVVPAGADGTSVNRLQVRVGEDETRFLVNGTVVHTAPRTGMAGRADGIWGVRINHVMPGVRVADLGVVPS